MEDTIPENLTSRTYSILHVNTSSKKEKKKRK